MSGHSHWATIKRQKETADQQRGKIFSKLSRAIAIAARSGSDPETNFKLRLAVEKAKEFNLPKENILRAIRRGSGQEEGEKWEEITFEGYGPEGIGVIVETVTDNRNRTTAEIKNIFERGGGSLAGPGAVSYLFKKKGLITLEKTEKVDEQILRIIDLGVEDVEETEGAIKVYVAPECLKEMEEKVRKAGIGAVRGAELTMEAATFLQINDEQKVQRILGFIASLENHDDVQKIYANFNTSDSKLAKTSLIKN